jgi:hypothetical protein
MTLLPSAELWGRPSSVTVFAQATADEAAVQRAFTQEIDTEAAKVVASSGTAPVGGMEPPTSDVAPKELWAALPGLESRLARLEHLLGAQDTSVSSSGGVIPTLQAVEARLSVLDDAAFAELTRRAKLLALEAEAAGTPSGLSRKASLASPVGAPGLGRSEVGAADLRKLADAVHRWDGAAAALPALVSRLQVAIVSVCCARSWLKLLAWFPPQSLRVLHEEAAVFTSVLKLLYWDVLFFRRVWGDVWGCGAGTA